MESDGSLPCLQELTSSPYWAKRTHSSPSILFSKGPILILFSRPSSSSSKFSLTSRFYNQNASFFEKKMPFPSFRINVLVYYTNRMHIQI